MDRHFDTSLRELKELLVSMAGYVEKAIDTAGRALSSRDTRLIGEVYEFEREINKDHMAVDDACVKLLALQQPLAADLRLIVATLKINTDLERMGDQAVNIASSVERYLLKDPIAPAAALSAMLNESKSMVREAIDAFIQRDERAARSVLRRDDVVDALKTEVFSQTVEHMKENPGGDVIDQGLSVILISRNLERIGDHATNIAEDVIFAVTGDDVRHASHSNPERK